MTMPTTTTVPLADANTTMAPVPTFAPGSDRDEIGVRHPSYDAMYADGWKLFADLRAGDAAMRIAGVEYIPRETEELPEDYTKRLARAFLDPMYDRSIEQIVDKPFSRPVTIREEKRGDHGKTTKAPLPPELAPLIADVDGHETSLTQFLADVFDAGNQYGLSHVLVDRTPLPAGASRADEAAARARTNLVHVPPPSLIWWNTETRAGREVVTEVHIAEPTMVRSGAFKQSVEARIRVYREQDWELWAWNSTASKYVQIDAGTHAYPDGVPLVTYYLGKQTGMMTAEPPHKALANTNLEHWQSYADQKNIVHQVRVPILVAAGFREDELGGEDGESGSERVVIGPGRIVATRKHEATLGYVEHGGKAIECGAAELEKIEARGRALGLLPFIQTVPGDVKATQTAVDEAKSQTVIQRWIRRLEDAAGRILRVASRWVGINRDKELPDVDVYSDFAIGLAGGADGELLLKMRVSGEITREVYIRECQRRGIIAETLDVEAMVAELEEAQEAADAAAMAALEAANANSDEDDDDDDDAGTGGAAA